MVRKYSAGFVNKNRGTWRAIISYQEDGKQKRVSKSTGIKCYPGKDNRNKARAEEFLRQWREELVQQEAMSQPVHDMMPFYGYCERYLSMHPVKPVTMSGYLTTMRKILNTPLGNRPLAEVTGDDIREWEQDLRDNGLSETTISHNHAFVSMVLKYAFAEGRIARNPVLAVKRPRRAHRSINSITRELRAEILKKMDASSNESLAMSVRLALFTGMRRGEVCALKWCDVDLE